MYASEEIKNIEARVKDKRAERQKELDKLETLSRNQEDVDIQTQILNTKKEIESFDMVLKIIDNIKNSKTSKQ